MDSERVARYGRAATRWARLLAGGRAAPGLRVFYGWDSIPGPGEPVAGGTAKLQKLAERWPNRPTDFSLLYLGTTYLPRDLRPLVWLARRRRARIVVNQDGVAYPGWAGERTEALNVPLRRAVQAADHVVYQSEFSKRSSDGFLGEPRGSWEILPNAVDVDRFTPSEPPADGPVVLLGGDQTQAYRLELALETFRHVLDAHPGARLLVAGRLVSDPEPTMQRLGLVRSRRVPRAVRAGRGPGGVPPSARPPPHEGQRPLPDDGDRGAGLRPPRRVRGERRDGRAGRRRGRRRRAASRRVRARRASGGRRARLGRLAVLADRARYAAAARERAVARFALSDWLARHAALFASLVPERPPAAR